MVLQGKIKRLCLDAVLLSLSLVLSYLEATLPLTVLIPLPGFKLGLTNIIVTMVFVAVSPYDAAVISLCRILIMGLLFGNAQSFFISICGGLLSYVGLWLLACFFKRFFSIVGISIGCAALHNLGQLTAAAILFTTDVILGYLPALLIAALIFGSLTGMLLKLILPRFEGLVGKSF